MKTIRELAQQQLDLMEEIRYLANINMVTCGNCGTILLHDMKPFNEDNKITCFGCKSEMELSDCPDYWYEGCIENSEFDEDVIDHWNCIECGTKQGRHDQYFDEVCEVCHSDMENIKKKDEIESLLIDIFDRIGIETPSNYEDIVQFVFEDVCETADPVNWSASDVAIGFRRWIELK
jgi:hypothetical protein